MNDAAFRPEPVQFINSQRNTFIMFFGYSLNCNQCNNSPYCKGAHLWDTLPQYICELNSLKDFKQRLKLYHSLFDLLSFWLLYTCISE